MTALHPEAPSPPTVKNPLAVSLKHATKFFGETPILNNVSLEIPTGALVAFLGPSGCGKTTLLRCIQGLETLDSGELTVLQTPLSQNGRILPEVNLNVFRANIGMVFQQFNLFPHLNVLDNITLAPIHVKGEDPMRARMAAMGLLTKVGLEEKSTAFPAQLSGGQKQRVAIVRSLAMNPKLLLLDEPTSALDPLMRNEVLDLIQEISGQNPDMTTVVVTHELTFARHVADRLVIMERGQVVAQGTPDEILTPPRLPLIEAYFHHG